MLPKSRITNIKSGTEEWIEKRTAKFTSSQIYKLCAEKGFGDTGMSYIRTRVFEDISGTSTDRDILNESIAHGIVNEPIALRHFGAIMGLDFIVTQMVVDDENPRFSSTPDGLIMASRLDGESYEVITVETKCYQAENHIACTECTTPQEIKLIDRKAYFQVLDQMLVCHALKGYLEYFHPDLPKDKGGARIIEFNPMQRVGNEFPLIKDKQFLALRKQQALVEFEKIKYKLSIP